MAMKTIDAGHSAFDAGPGGRKPGFFVRPVPGGPSQHGQLMERKEDGTTKKLGTAKNEQQVRIFLETGKVP